MGAGGSSAAVTVGVAPQVGDGAHPQTCQVNVVEPTEGRALRSRSRPADRASFLKLLVEKDRQADHGVAPALPPGPAPGRAVTPSGGDQHDLAPALAHPP